MRNGPSFEEWQRQDKECPWCREWIEIGPETPEEHICAECKQPITVNRDVEGTTLHQR